MASLATHFFAFLLLCPLGIRRLLCFFSLYLENPSLYRSKPWYFSEPRWKNLDLYSLLIVLPIASFSLLFIFLLVSGRPIFRFAFLQQSALVFLFWVLIILLVYRENFDHSFVPEHFIYAFAGVSFLVEYFLTGDGITGLGGALYELLGQLCLVCAACCFFLSARPAAFFAEFMLCYGLILKGTWVLQIGLSLYTDVFSLKGCHNMSEALTQGITDVKCDLDEDRSRAMALINLVFIGHVTLVIIICFVLFGLLARNLGSGETTGAGTLLSTVHGSDHAMTQSIPEFEIE